VLDCPGELVERVHGSDERAVLLLRAQLREAVAEPRGRDHHQCQERHEQDEEELRSEAELLQHLRVVGSPPDALEP